MMKRFVCAMALALLTANVVNAAAVEQDDWGFSVESNSGSSYSAGPSIQTFGPQTFRQPAVRSNVTPFRAPQFGQPVYGAQPYYAPYYNVPAPRTFGQTTTWREVYQAPYTLDFN